MVVKQTVEIVTSAQKRLVIIVEEDEFHHDIGTHEEHFPYYKEQAEKLMGIILSHTNGYFQHELKKLVNDGRMNPY